MRSHRVAVLLAAALIALTALPASADRDDGFKVRVLVITMFSGETAPWLANRKLPVTIPVTGVPQPLRCDRKGLCVVTTEMGKANTAATMTALMTTPRLDLHRAYFLTAGIAGTPPDQGTLGFAAWARWVVDFDLGHHVLPDEAPDIPNGYIKLNGTTTSVFRLNDRLVDTAYRVTRNVKLTDSPQAAETRSRYPGQAGKKPFVTICDTATGDNYWAGKGLSQRAAYITSLHTNGKGTYCTTQMEDNATAAVLARHGHLNRYLNLRTASNFDQPYPGQSVKDAINSISGGFKPSVDNAYLVASTMADHLLKH